MKKWIYKDNITGILKELSSHAHQKKAWLNVCPEAIMTISFIEAANMLLGDCLVADYLEEGEILFDKAASQALRELVAAVHAVDEYRTEEEIIEDPLRPLLKRIKPEQIQGATARNRGMYSTYMTR